MKSFKVHKENDAVAVKSENRPSQNVLEEMIGGGLPEGPSKKITIESSGNMSQQELIGKIIDGLKTEPKAAAAPSEGNAEKERIIRDPYHILDFTKRVDTYRDEMLGICWDMREHLEEARPYMNGSATYLDLIEQMIGMTSELQKLMDTLGEHSYNETRKAQDLIDAFENTRKG